MGQIKLDGDTSHALAIAQVMKDLLKWVHIYAPELEEYAARV